MLLSQDISAPLLCPGILQAGHMKRGQILFSMVVFLPLIPILLRYFSIRGTVINTLGIYDVISVLKVLVSCGLMPFASLSFKRWQDD